MAKLYLKFEQAVLKEFTLGQGAWTIGRLPDNQVQIDNLAVSGHHAKLYWEADHYVIEDNNSLNGTYVNNHRVSKAVLNHDDQVLIGKHTLLFKDEWHEDAPADAPPDRTVPIVPTLDSTVVLDTKQAKEMIAHAAESARGTAAAAAPAKERIAMLTVMHGKTDQAQYVLSSKLNVIGKSEMASIKLKGWFAPKVAAVINHRDNKYFIAASEKEQKVKVNGSLITGQHELADGDFVEVARIKLTFTLAE